MLCRLLLALPILLALDLGPAARSEAQPPFERAPDPDRRPDALLEVEVTPEILELGERLYREGSCLTCHGAGGAGTRRGPRLDDREWLHGDGSLGAIRRVIWSGVPKRLQRGPMRPFEMLPQGGESLDSEELDALSAWVWSLSRTPSEGE